jgi:rubrerythrin
MDDANRMLSQEEIDTLLTSHFAGNQGDTPENNTKSSTAVLAPEKPAHLLPQTSNPLEIASAENNTPQYQSSNSLEEAITDLSKRLKILEEAIENLQNQKNIDQKSINENSNPLNEKFNRFDEQLMDITEKLKGTAGYNINKTYTCRQCGSTGLVGIRVRCNQCGQEGWWGWWPKKNK